MEGTAKCVSVCAQPDVATTEDVCMSGFSEEGLAALMVRPTARAAQEPQAPLSSLAAVRATPLARHVQLAAIGSTTRGTRRLEANCSTVARPRQSYSGQSSLAVPTCRRTKSPSVGYAALA